MKLLSYSKWSVLFICFICLSGCKGILSGSAGPCSQYKYDSDQQTWVDALNKPVSCSLADNKRFFEYIPGQGCNFWKEQFQLDETVDFREMIVRTGQSGSSIGRKYCVLQRYIARDKSGQVLLVDDGAFCFAAHPTIENNYVFTNCENADREKDN